MQIRYIILCDKPGRLGNRILWHAHFVAFAKAHPHFRIINASFDNYYGIFKSFDKDPLGRFPEKANLLSFLSKFRFYRKLLFLTTYAAYRIINRFKIDNDWVTSFDYDYDKTIDLKNQQVINQLSKTKFNFIRGFWCNSDIKNHIETIKQHFKFSKSTPIGGSYNIGVHIRRTDYKYLLKGKYYFDISTYVKWIEQIIEKYKVEADSKIFICSDCFDELYNIPELSHPQIRLENRFMIEDFDCLMQCDIIYAVPSTFSAMAAFLGQNKLIFLENEGDEIHKLVVSTHIIEDFYALTKSDFIEMYTNSTRNENI
ncbi:MAG: alpha-1,2-fucosyltransferase [Flavobacteriales bacterium]|nr:alpha-1,2-fucosyltransferase [Flavobacteriales bacterium]